MVSNALKKFTKVALVDSSFLTAVMMLFLDLTFDIKVEYFLLKTDCIGLYSSWFSIKKLIICFRTNFPYIFGKTGNKNIGLYPESVLAPGVSTSDLLLQFYTSGTFSFWIKLFIIIVNGVAMYDATGLVQGIIISCSIITMCSFQLFFCFVNAVFTNFGTIWIGIF